MSHDQHQHPRSSRPRHDNDDNRSTKRVAASAALWSAARYHHDHDDGNNCKRSKLTTTTADHGQAFVPGSGPVDRFPQSLDHYRRGQGERHVLRPREDGEARHHHDNSTTTTSRPTKTWDLDVTALLDQCLQQTSRQPDAAAVHAVLTAHGRDGDWWHHPTHGGDRILTALLSLAGRRRRGNRDGLVVARQVWRWMDEQHIAKNVFHCNAMISVLAQHHDYHGALQLLDDMRDRGIARNEVTFSSAISACEKCGQWRTALQLLDDMERECRPITTAIAYNAAISACEKGLQPQAACQVLARIQQAGITPTVVSYAAVIAAAEKGGQWKLALDILDEMQEHGHGINVVAYSAAISALAKGQQWEKALELFRQVQAAGGTPSIVCYNATMSALEKGMQWERALGLFEEMKMRNMHITVVSYGSAMSACEKGLQYRQCLEYLDEMTEMGIEKNVIIYGAAMSCMEKCCRADISFQLMDRMKMEGLAPNVHIFNSVISACARNNLWGKGYELFCEMETARVQRDVVTYNAVLDAVCNQIELGRQLFEEGVRNGFYAKVSRLGEQWFELDLHFLSLGGGEIALGWWFEKCLVPYFTDTTRLATVSSVSIVTGFGKTRTRGPRHGDDGMKKRVLAMLHFMNVHEVPQQNAGRVCVDKDRLVEEVRKNGGQIKFDSAGYAAWKKREITTNNAAEVEQKIRARFRPEARGSGKPPFVRLETAHTWADYRLDSSSSTPADRLNAEEDAQRSRDGIESVDRLAFRGGRGRTNGSLGGPGGGGNFATEQQRLRAFEHGDSRHSLPPAKERRNVRNNQPHESTGARYPPQFRGNRGTKSGGPERRPLPGPSRTQEYSRSDARDRYAYRRNDYNASDISSGWHGCRPDGRSHSFRRSASATRQGQSYRQPQQR